MNDFLLTHAANANASIRLCYEAAQKLRMVWSWAFLQWRRYPTVARSSALMRLKFLFSDMAPLPPSPGRKRHCICSLYNYHVTAAGIVGCPQGPGSFAFLAGATFLATFRHSAAFRH
eukprot:11192702-Lingulodinium_polyedra.AAC.1